MSNTPATFDCCPGRKKHHLILNRGTALTDWQFWRCIFCDRRWNVFCLEIVAENAEHS